MNVSAIVTCMTEGELPFVHQAVSSVRAQTHPCQMLVLLPDNNSAILACLRALGSDFTLCPVPMNPVGIVRNLGVARANTEWVAFLDGDDVWAPTKIACQMAAAQKTDSALIGTRHLLIREDGAPFFYAFAKRMPMPSSWLVKRDLMIAEPFSDRPVWEDAELWKRVEKRNVKTYTLKDYLLLYRVRHLSSSTRYSREKHRKDQFARLSTVAGMGPILLLSSRLWSILSTPLNTRGDSSATRQT